MSNNVERWGVTMRKISHILFIILILTFTYLCPSAFAEHLYYNDAFHVYDADEIVLNVNGSKINQLPMAPVIIEDRTMVPVREVFEALGSDVIWHDDTCQVEIKEGSTSVLIKIGDRNTYVDGVATPIQEGQPLPMLIGYKADSLKSMVPVRFVAEKLGYNVGWNDDTRTVSIESKKIDVDDTEIDVIVPPTQIKDPIPEKYGEFGKITAVKNNESDDIYINAKYGISPHITRYSNPERVVFDFDGATFNNVGDTVSLNGNCVKSVRYSNYEGRARVVLDINRSTQVHVLSSSDGILLKAIPSENDEITYDTYLKRVYFDQKYDGVGNSVSNGYSVTFKDLQLETQKILINDGNIYEIIITKKNSGCIVTVDGSNKLTYNSVNGFYKTDAEFKPEDDEDDEDKIIGEGTVVIDAGHGGYDPGAVGYNSAGDAVAYESHINLALAKLVEAKLRAQGVNVVMTRTKDEFISLAGRAEIENKSNCDLFVSIHCNSIDNSSIKGTQVYHNPSSELGTLLSKNIYDKLVDLTGLSPKNTQNGANLYVIRNTKRPAALVEAAFISNANDRSYLLSESGQDTIATAITKGIIKTIADLK